MSSDTTKTAPDAGDKAVWQDSPDWEVSIEPDPSGDVASVVLQLSKGGHIYRHRLDARAATELSNALIVEAERAQFRAAYRKPS